MKKWIVSLSVILVLCGIRFTDPWFLDMVRLKAMDQHQRNQTTQILDTTVTIEINNETIRQRGQWPWDRETLGNEIIKLYQAGASLVVVPILFADPDRGGKDAFFADMLKQTPTIIGQIPTNDRSASGVVRGVASVGADWKPWVYQYSGAVGPIPEFANSANAVGMMIVAPEADGVVRRMPLVVSVDGVLYPSISMEVLRMAAGDISFQMKTGQGGVEKLRIPKYKMIDTDANGNIWLDFQWKTKTYPLHKKLPDLTGKIVILSMTASGLGSPVATPVGVIQSHDLIAASLATMMTGRNLTRPFWTDLAELAVSGVGALILTIVVLTLTWWFGAVLLPLFLVGSFYGSSYLFTEYSYLVDWSYPVLTMFVVWAISAFLRFMEEFRLRQQIKKQFEYYLDPRQVAILQKDPSKLRLGGERREMSFLFMDIVGFTPISEHYKNNDDPEGLVECINDYLNRMTNIVLKNGGTVDKYMGDCIMAFWNAPLDCENHAEMAVRTSMECAIETEALKQSFKDKGLPEINIGSGVNTGTCIVGNMGSDTRFDYSVIGDAVNLAARLEAATRNYQKDIGGIVNTIFSSYTMEQLPDDLKGVELDKIKVKGKEELVTIYKPFEPNTFASGAEY
jgi:adenylate cyclase|tara:strand:+ start:144 stop:2012 length:1869 start_codon:yes stop_codon:yes gene_type:complete